jgi:hypothetical protein
VARGAPGRLVRAFLHTLGQERSLDLIHRHYDVFELNEQPETLWPDGLAVTFLYDREGLSATKVKL